MKGLSHSSVVPGEGEKRRKKGEEEEEGIREEED